MILATYSAGDSDIILTTAGDGYRITAIDAVSGETCTQDFEYEGEAYHAIGAIIMSECAPEEFTDIVAKVAKTPLKVHMP